MWCTRCDGQYGHVQKDTATHCNTLQHTATRCNTLQHAATHCTTLQHVYDLECAAYNANAIWAVKKWHISFQPAFLNQTRRTVDHYIHVHMHTVIHKYICINTYTNTYVLIHTRWHIHIHTHIHIHGIYIHIRIYKYPDEEGVGENIGDACAQDTSLWIRKISIILRFKELVELRAEISGRLGFQNIYYLKPRRSLGWLWLVGSINL